MKEKLNREFLDLRKFDYPIDAIELIKNITSNPNVENDPFYIVDLEDICNKHINWITRLPRVEPHYAIKCNTDEMLLKLLAFLGAGFDCASKNEIQKVLDLGVSPDRIIFANPCKQASYIKYAYKVGVNYMTFDNEYELHKIKEHHPNAKCVLRIITNDQDAVCRFSMKFGADMETSFKLIELASKLDLDLVGISFHVGSGQMSPKAFSESIENARKLFDFAREEFNIKMHLLDLGGGYPGSSDSMDLFNSIAKEINRSLEKFFPVELFNQINGTSSAEYADERKLRIIAEPGRYYSCSAFTLCVSVIAKRVMSQTSLQQEQDKEALKANTQLETIGVNGDQVDHIDTNKSIMYYINDGVYASFNCLFYDHAECLPILIKEDRPSDTKLYKSSVWGPTCDGLDVVLKEHYLPELNTGEFLVFKNMGAYTIAGAVPFNGIPLARCIYVASQSWDTIKDAFVETSSSENASCLSSSTTSNLVCSAAATLAFTRALQHHQTSNENSSNYENVVASCLDRCQLIDPDNTLNDEHLNSEEDNSITTNSSNGNNLDQSSTTVDCAITC